MGKIEGHTIITNAYAGAIDLYHGIPNLLGATIVDAQQGDAEDYETILILRDVEGVSHQLIVRRAV